MNMVTEKQTEYDSFTFDNSKDSLLKALKQIENARVNIKSHLTSIKGKVGVTPSVFTHKDINEMLTVELYLNKCAVITRGAFVKLWATKQD